MHLFITFLLLVTISVAILILGLIIVFRPDFYSRWVRSSIGGSRTTWIDRGSADDARYGWRVKIVGVAFAVGGATSIILSVWICWFQK